MRQRTRKVLFYGFSAFFLIIGGYILMTAQGWTFDTKNLSFVKTGALFLKFSPDDATLIINGKPRRVSSGVLQSGTLIKNLAPGNYNIILSKSGYHNWEKNLTATSGLVTRASQINLWPYVSEHQPLTEEVIKNFWLTNKDITYQNTDNVIVFNKHALKGEEVVYTNNRSKFLVTQTQKNHFLIDLDNPSTALNIDHLFNSLKQRQLLLPGTIPLRQVFIHPFSPHKLLVTSLTSLYLLDIKKFQLEKLITVDTITTFRISNNEAFVISRGDNGSTLSIINLLLKTTSNYPLLSTSSISDMQVNPKGTKIFIQNSEDDLLSFDRSSRMLKKLAENIKDSYLSPEEKRIALITKDNVLSILYLDNYQSDVKYLAGTITKIPIAEEKKIKNFSWIPKLLNHAVVLLEEDLVISELDSRTPINAHTFFTDVQKYVLENKNLYVLRKNGELLKIDLGNLN